MSRRKKSRVMLFRLNGVTHGGKSRNSACCCGLFSVSMVSAFLGYISGLGAGTGKRIPALWGC
jgi:hypothetical protein